MKRVAGLQLGTENSGTFATLDKILSYENEIASEKLDLVVLPEALLGGYPKGESFGARLGYRLPEGRDSFANYYANAVSVPGPEIEALCGMSTRTGASLVAGVIERDGHTLYCSAVIINPNEGLVAKHRKLLPTGVERLVWGSGDGSTMPVVDSQAGRVGAVICWENYMPLLRTAMYSQGIEIYCAPTVDDRDVWQSSMQHIAYEGRCFVVSCCQILKSPAELGITAYGRDDNERLIGGGSVVYGPLGERLAGPLRDGEGLVIADIDLQNIPRARYDLDVVGHYSRPDIFQLSVNTTPRSTTTFRNEHDNIPNH